MKRILLKNSIFIAFLFMGTMLIIKGLTLKETKAEEKIFKDFKSQFNQVFKKPVRDSVTYKQHPCGKSCYNTWENR